MTPSLQTQYTPLPGPFACSQDGRVCGASIGGMWKGRAGLMVRGGQVEVGTLYQAWHKPEEVQMDSSLSQNS